MDAASPHNDPTRHRPPRAAMGAHLVWLVTAAWLAGCGGALRPVERPATAPMPSAPADPSALPILIEPTPPAALAPFAVNPTIAVSARPGVRVAPVADDIGWWRARAALARGEWPAAAPEAFVDAVTAQGPAPILSAAIAPSPYRPGYHGLRILIAPPAGAAPAAVVLVLEARRDLLDDDARRALQAIMNAPAAPGVLLAAERPRWLGRPGDAAAAGSPLDGLVLAGPADVPAAVAEAQRALPAGGVVVVVAHRDTPRSTPVAHVSPGPEFADRLDAASRRRPWLEAARLAVDFDGRHVERYRLIGFDGGASGGRAATLWHGRSTAVLFEVKLRADRPAGALGRVALSGQAPDGRAVSHVAALSAEVDAQGDVAVALLAAAVAEKLRAAWWARGIGWPRLAADADTLSTHPGARRLRPVIEGAMGLERRPDRFAGHGPIDRMDPDAVPVLRPR